MEKLKRLLAGIDVEGLDIPELAEKVKQGIIENEPVIKKGLKSVQSDLLKTGKVVFDWLASDELEEKLK